MVRFLVNGWYVLDGFALVEIISASGKSIKISDRIIGRILAVDQTKTMQAMQEAQIDQVREWHIWYLWETEIYKGVLVRREKPVVNKYQFR